MQLKKGQIIDLDIHALAFGGAGIGRLPKTDKHEGLAVFVEKTIPGDKIKAEFTRIKSNFAEAKLVEILEPSKDRKEPKCKYFGICGGCQLQFMPYEKQLEFKRQHVIDAFERIGKIYNPPVNEIIGAEEEFYYRNKMEFSFGYDAQMNFTLGMHYPGRKFDILDLDVCYLQSEFSVEVVNKTRDLMKKLDWPPFKYSNGEGFLKGLFVREGRHTNEVLVNLVTSDKVPEEFREGLKKFTELLLEIAFDYSKAISVCWSKVISKRGSPRQTEENFLHGKKFLTEKMVLKNGDEMTFDINPQAFFQVNTIQGEILYSQVLKFALQKAHSTALDLFCGTGTIALFLAKHIPEVIGIELNEEAIKAARKNSEKNKIFNVEFFAGDVAKVLPKLKHRPSLIVVDPPRAGLTEKMIQSISDFGCNQVIYVSCNPSTLARDCNWLKEFGFIVKEIQPVDMFPQTYHIEAVCLLERD